MASQMESAELQQVRTVGLMVVRLQLSCHIWTCTLRLGCCIPLERTSVWTDLSRIMSVLVMICNNSALLRYCFCHVGAGVCRVHQSLQQPPATLHRQLFVVTWLAGCVGGLEQSRSSSSRRR